MLSEWASWRWVLFVNVPIGVVAARRSARRVLPETERQHGRFDLAGALTSTLGMTALVYGFVHAASDGWSDAGTIGSFAAGLVLLAASSLIELRADVADHAAAAVRRPQPQRAPTSPGCCSSPG